MARLGGALEKQVLQLLKANFISGALHWKKKSKQMLYFNTNNAFKISFLDSVEKYFYNIFLKLFVCVSRLVGAKR